MGKRRWTLLIDDALDATWFLTGPHVTVEKVEDIPDPPRVQTFEITTPPNVDPITRAQLVDALRHLRVFAVREVTQ